MSAKSDQATLLRAAQLLRSDWPDCDCHEFERAVADLLEDIALTWGGNAKAFTAAHAYLKGRR